MKHEMLKSPLQWVGGKGRLAEWILSKMRPHSLYAEVCCGGASVFWAKPKEAGIVEVLNDADGELINFYRELHKRGRRLAMEVNGMPYSRKLFNQMLAARPTRSFRRAVRFWYLNRVCFGGRRVRPTFGVKASDHTLVLPNRVLLDLDATIERLRGVSFEFLDVFRVIELYDRPYALFYVDPPYYELEQDFYFSQFTPDDHRRLAAALRGVQGQWLLSYNACPEVREMYKGFTVERRDIRYTLGANSGSGHGRKTTGELLIGNR